MKFAQKEHDEISKTFQDLGLTTAEERERFQSLSKLEQVGKTAKEDNNFKETQNINTTNSHNA